MRAHRQGGVGKPSYLTTDQEAQVVAAATQGAFPTAEAVRQWVQQQFGVTYTAGSIYTLLQRLRIRPKVPRPRHEKADPQAQTTWKKGGSGPVWSRPG